jgi:hypothetical protein
LEQSRNSIGEREILLRKELQELHKGSHDPVVEHVSVHAKETSQGQSKNDESTS